jgi:hypothetical protein
MTFVVNIISIALPAIKVEFWILNVARYSHEEVLSEYAYISYIAGIILCLISAIRINQESSIMKYSFTAGICLLIPLYEIYRERREFGLTQEPFIEINYGEGAYLLFLGVVMTFITSFHARRGIYIPQHPSIPPQYQQESMQSSSFNQGAPPGSIEVNIFCTACGSKNTQKVVFCGNCGTKLN